MKLKMFFEDNCKISKGKIHKMNLVHQLSYYTFEEITSILEWLFPEDCRKN